MLIRIHTANNDIVIFYFWLIIWFDCHLISDYSNPSVSI